MELIKCFIDNLIYHKFYNRYGYIINLENSYDLTSPERMTLIACIRWESDDRGIALPRKVSLEEIELVDFKHHIRKVNERANDGKKTQSMEVE